MMKSVYFQDGDFSEDGEYGSTSTGTEASDLSKGSFSRRRANYFNDRLNSRNQTMKKYIAAALLSALVTTPAFADDTAARASAKKPATAMPSGHKHDHKMMDMKGECDAEHGMGEHHGHEMMGGRGADMMMEADMHMLGALALSEEQQSKINELADELKHNNWATQGLINDETAKLRDLYEADKRDTAAISKEYQKVFDLKRQMIETYLNTQNRIEEILTAEQRAKMKDARHEMHHMYGHPMQ